MMLTSGILLASLASIIQAFLLPPTVSSSDADIINTLPFEVELQASGKTLELECTNCPVATWQPSGVAWVQGVESKLQLQFFIQHDDLDRLYLNGIQIFPVLDAVVSKPLSAVQVVADKDIDAVGDLRLGFELAITPVVKSGDGLELISVHLQIVEIADKFVDGLESVELKLLRTPNGELMIGDLYFAPTSNPGGKDCNTLVCQLRKVIADKLSQFKKSKGCGRKPGHHKARPAKGPKPHHHHHHKHHGFSRLLRALRSIAFHVLVPVFVGVMVGFTASLVGLIAGQIIVLLWRRLYRRGQKANGSKAQKDEVVVKNADTTEDESKPFLDHQDPPPMYENIVENEKGAE